MGDFTDEELAKLRIILQMSQPKLNRLLRIADEDEKWEWLWANMRKFGITIFAIVAAIAAFRNDLVSIMSWAFGKGGDGGS